MNKRISILVALFCLSLAGELRAHIHVQVSFANNAWRLFLYDFESGEFDPADIPLFVAPAAHGFVPPGAFTNFLGRGGSEVWTLPEVENPDLPFLGIGTSGIAPGTFANNQVRLELRSVKGPGHFALYTVDPFGAPVVHMNSRDGIDAAFDFITVPAQNGHAHVNWSFSAPGTYRIGFGASGITAAGGPTNRSATVEYIFNIQDIPGRPQITNIGKTNDTIYLTVNGAAGRTCRIWIASTFPVWSSVTNFTLTSDTQTVALPAPAAMGFFRASFE